MTEEAKLTEQEPKPGDGEGKPKDEPKTQGEPQNESPKAKYTEEDMNSKIDAIIARERAKYEKQLADLKEQQSEAEKLKKMNEQEKTEYETKKLQKRIEELELEKNLTEQQSIARKELAGANIKISDELLALIVSPEAEKTKAAVDSFKNLFQENVNAAVQDALKRNPPKAEGQKHEGASYGAQRAAKYNAEKVPTKE